MKTLYLTGAGSFIRVFTVDYGRCQLLLLRQFTSLLFISVRHTVVSTAAVVLRFYAVNLRE